MPQEKTKVPEVVDPFSDVDAGADYRVIWRNGMASHHTGTAIRQRLGFYRANALRITKIGK